MFKCISRGLFSRDTIKPLEKIYNYEKEKKKIKNLIRFGRTFAVSGLRRVGKTTIIRSISKFIDDHITLYINMRGIKQGFEYDYFFESLKNEMLKELRFRRIYRPLEHLKNVTFIFASPDIKLRYEFALLKALEELTELNKVILIIDDAHKLLKISKVIEFLIMLYDEMSSSISIILITSLMSIKEVDNKSHNYTNLLDDEIILKPWDKRTSESFLKKGFEECWATVNYEDIDAGVDFARGIVGWLCWYGRLAVVRYIMEKKVNPPMIIKKIVEETRTQIFDEIADFLRERRNVDEYLKLIIETAKGEAMTVSDASKIIDKDPSTAFFYLSELVRNGIMLKRDGYYTIADPVVERVAVMQEFIREVKLRI